MKIEVMYNYYVIGNNVLVYNQFFGTSMIIERTECKFFAIPIWFSDSCTKVDVDAIWKNVFNILM